MALGPAKPSEGRRAVSGNEWPASDRHAVSWAITNRPGTFPQSQENRAPLTSHGTAGACSLPGASFGIKKKIIICLFFLWSFWRVQSPGDGLCCWVCVPSLFCRPEELGSSVADCLRALQTEAGGSLTAGHADQGLQGQTGRPHRLRPVLHSRLSESS